MISNLLGNEHWKRCYSNICCIGLVFPEGTTRPNVYVVSIQRHILSVCLFSFGQKHRMDIRDHHVWIMLHQNIWGTRFTHSWGLCQGHLSFRVRSLSEAENKQQVLNLDVSRITQFSPVTQLCPALCNTMNRSTPGLPVDHQLPQPNNC